MNILHINHSDIGGAAIAAIRHHEAMISQGINSKMLVLHKYSDRNDIIEYPTWRFEKNLRRISDYLFRKYYNFYGAWSWNHFGYDLSNSKEVMEADIIILHWINRNSLSLKSIESILKTGKPVYWFMHDMWPITGGCHHSFECEKFKKSCGSCLMMHNRKGGKNKHDLSYRQLAEKLKTLTPYENLSFITPSIWLANKVKQSKVALNHKVMVARNILNTNIFQPLNKTVCRQELNLPQDKKLILFGANDVGSPYKGWHYLEEALADMPDNVVCVVYGSDKELNVKNVPISIINVGKISNTQKLIQLYSACDVFVTPSIADNYPNVLIEAMACGLVCVGFKTGGIPEIIIDNENGLIVQDYSSKSLRNGILQILYEPNYQILSKNAVESIKKNNSYNNIIQLPQLLN